MSNTTYAALEDAIRAHVADENGGAYLTDWFLSAAGALPEDPNATAYTYANSNGSPHGWLGLLGMAQRRAMRWEEGEGE